MLLLGICVSVAQWTGTARGERWSGVIGAQLRELGFRSSIPRCQERSALRDGLGVFLRIVWWLG